MSSWRRSLNFFNFASTLSSLYSLLGLDLLDPELSFCLSRDLSLNVPLDIFLGLSLDGDLDLFLGDLDRPITPTAN